MKELRCPKCGNPEIHPAMNKLLIRANKVHDSAGWWSECLVCAGYYDKDLNETPENYKPNDKHWFIIK